MSNNCTNNQVSDEWKNKLRQAISEFWESQYKTFAKGRIKRMRKTNFYDIIPTGRIKRIKAKTVYKFVDLSKRIGKKDADAFPINYTHITRWNRH